MDPARERVDRSGSCFHSAYEAVLRDPALCALLLATGALEPIESQISFRKSGGRCLTEWLQKHVAAERHQAVLASADCINDIAAADDEADITDTLGLDSWPPLARRRFLRAWRQLKEESQGDAAPRAAAPAARG